MTTTDTLVLGDFNTHNSSWYSSSTDSRGTMLESIVSGSNFGILNFDSPTRLPGNANPSSPDVSLGSPSLITSTNWQTTTNTNLGSDYLLILISLQMDVTINLIQNRSSINLKQANWDRYSREIKDNLSKRWLPTDCQKGERVLRAIIRKVVSHHILSGRHRLNPEPVPTEILKNMRARDDVRSRDYSFALQEITFNCSQVSSPKQITNYFNQQFTTSKLCSKMSPTLFNFYLADMLRPTEPVKRICYADDLTVWASGLRISELEHMMNGYLTEMSYFLQDNSLLISAPKSTVILFTPDPMQANGNTHPNISVVVVYPLP